jgi:hypothetical protein
VVALIPRPRPSLIDLLVNSQPLESALGPLAHAADRALRAADLNGHFLSRLAVQDLLDDGAVIWSHRLE